MDFAFSGWKETTKHPRVEIPHQTPRATIDHLLSLCVNDEYQEFEETMDRLLQLPNNTSSSSQQPAASFVVRELGDVMMEAITQDNVRFVSKLLSSGYPISCSFAQYATLYKAKGVLECYINVGWDINEPVGDLRPPVLAYAVDDEEMATWLLNHGADPNRRCEIDRTPLTYAVQIAPMSTIKLMLDRGGDAKKGQPLQYAVLRTTETNEVISFLVDRGAPLNATMREDGRTLMRFYPLSLKTPLHIAAEYRIVDVVCHLLRLGVDTSVKDANGNTALEWAHRLKRIEVVKVLLENESRRATGGPPWQMFIVRAAFGITLLAIHRRRQFRGEAFWWPCHPRTVGFVQRELRPGLRAC